MKKRIKRIVIAAALVVFLSDLAIGLLLFKSRAFSHLAIWNIVESGSKESFETNNERSKISKDNELEEILSLAQSLWELNSAQPQALNRGLRWDSPEGLLRQIKEGSGSGNCFHSSIILSTRVDAMGKNARLWALENKKFDGIAHTITEVFITGLKKWVFIDVALGFYATENNTPLSFLDFRDRLLEGKLDKIRIVAIDDRMGETFVLPSSYKHLVICVLLRMDNDFVNKYNHRYGVLFPVRRLIDKLPNQLRMGIDYLFGKKDTFMHYTDKFSPSLKQDIIVAKIFFYWFVFSMAGLCVLLVALLRNLSKKETLHR